MLKRAVILLVSVIVTFLEWNRLAVQTIEVPIVAIGTAVLWLKRLAWLVSRYALCAPRYLPAILFLPLVPMALNPLGWQAIR